MEAVDLFEKFDGIRLNGTYTGKAMAALIDQVRSHGSINEVTLFWANH
jgi:1-aminocyclopropane-1-carboxylate deaminase/D-cysteine desulfhydrase-like pyridoxal-dependent ACC family enzyme